MGAGLVVDRHSMQSTAIFEYLAWQEDVYILKRWLLNTFGCRWNNDLLMRPSAISWKKDCYTIATYLEMQPQQIICGLSTHKIRSQAEAFQDVPGNCKHIVFFVEDESNEHQLDRNRCPCHFVLPCDQAVLWYIHTTVFHVLLEVLNNARYFKTALTLLFFLPIDKFYIESKRNEMLSCHQATKFPINSGSLDKKSHQSPSGHDVYSVIARCYVVGVQNARFFE